MRRIASHQVIRTEGATPGPEHLLSFSKSKEKLMGGEFKGGRGVSGRQVRVPSVGLGGPWDDHVTAPASGFGATSVLGEGWRCSGCPELQLPAS